MLSSRLIKATQDYADYDRPVHAPYLRKTFTLESVPDSATLTLTCTGFYRLWINGVEITNGRLAPYITNPDQMLFYDTYDVRAWLRPGKNCIGLLLGNGMSNAIGGFIWDLDQASFRSAPQVALSFEASLGAQTVCFEADDSFLCAPSPIVFDDLRSGEHYDATMEIEGWNLPDFDDSAWTPAWISGVTRGKRMVNDTDRVVITKELPAVKYYKGRIAPNVFPQKIRSDAVARSKTAFYQPEAQEQGYIFEFAENTAFVPKLKIRGRKGQRIALQCAEYCSADGEMSFEGIARFYPQGFAQRDVYICKGDGEEEYIPSFTYHGGRYVMVIGADEEQIKPDTVTMLVQNSDLRECGSFHCSDPIANRLQQNARISDLANFVYFPTDCPHREKNGWTGDAALSAEHMLQNLGVEKSYKQWLRMVCAAQREDGALPGIVPTAGWGFAWGNGPVWDQVIVELPYQVYLYRGDSSLFLECSDAVFRYLNYLSKRRDGRGLLHFGLGDYCHALRDNAENHLCPVEVSDTITAYSICRRAEWMFGVVGLKAQQQFAALLGQELNDAIRRDLVDWNTCTVKGDCQCAQAMGLYYDVFQYGERQPAYQRLLEMIHHNGDRLDFGIIGARTVFRVLAAFGDAELAYRMITRTDAPSYGFTVSALDMVSVPEVFLQQANGYQASLNHHFLSDYSGFFLAHIAGLQINPHRTDPSYVRVQPNFISTLQDVYGDQQTVGGRIAVSWKREADRIVLCVEKDDGVLGEIRLPDGYIFISAPGYKPDWPYGRHILELRSGRYEIGVG